MPTKKNPCWPGYEPVKGKPAHSQGSCKPKATTKLSESEKKFRSQRKKQLAEWKKRHPGTSARAAQHLGAPAKKKKSSAATSARKAA